MKPYLPQNEPNPTQRENALNRNRDDYQFNHEALAPVPVLDRVPKREKFSVGYTAKRLGSMASLPANMV
ncbi:MAG: lipoxygenase, partial [Merismopedia sp. SIO2A8]|nr:lipoxygenase [Merismopedia sp. SIO2A8]